MEYNQHLAEQVLNNEPFDADEVIEQVLAPCSDIYNNGEDESPLTDRQYDYINRLAKAQRPYHAFFTGVGADVRGGKITLPYQMGSLDQVEIGGLEQWKRNCKLSKSDRLVIMAKLDGSSGMAILTKQTAALRIAYSRGNGLEGADITRHLKHMIKDLDGETVLVDVPVRGENIISKHNFDVHVQPNFKRSDGSEYKNPRNAVSGMMNSESNDQRVYQYIDYVAYQRLDRDDMDKEDQLLELEDMGFIVPWYAIKLASECTEDYLKEVIDNLRETYPYEIDGVVVEVDSAEIRKRLDPFALNPGYAMKYKTLSNDNYVETEVVEVEYNVSKTRYAKPRVIVKPCKLPGITCTYVTGYNAKYILDNNIGPGTVVGISRMGDVVPNIVKVVKSTTAQLPEGEWEWNDTEVDIVMTGDDVNQEVLIQQLTETARSLDIDGLREGIATQIVEAGNYADFNEMFSSIVAWPKNWWTDLIGSNGGKIYDDMHAKLSSVPLYIWLGSMPHFGRGIGRRKMKALLEALGIETMEQFNLLNVGKISGVEKFQDKSADKIVGGIISHDALYQKLKGIISFQAKEKVEGGALQGQKVVVTGFRDATVEAFIEKAGGEVQSGISAKTTLLVAISVSGNSGKIKKAKDLNASGKANITLMDLTDFRKKFMEVNTGVEF